MWWSEIIFFILGAIASILIEKVFNAMYGSIGDSWRNRSAKVKRERIAAHGSLIQNGDEATQILEFIPHGWESANIEILLQESPSIDELLHQANPEDLPAPINELITAVETSTAKYNSKGIAEDGTWNGPGLAIDAYNLATRSAVGEKPILQIWVHETNYATSQAIGQKWENRFLADLRSGSPDFQQRYCDSDRYLEPIPGMINSIGLNAMVISSDEKLILSKRSRKAASARRGFHNPINEGMLPSDLTDGKLDPIAGILRGAHEELGIESIPRAAVHVHAAILDVRRSQFGLLGVIDFRSLPPRLKEAFTSDRILNRFRYAHGVDRYENRALEVFSWDAKTVLSLLKEPEWIEHGRVNLALTATSLLSGLGTQKKFFDAL